jgi:hypothetical protein
MAIMLIDVYEGFPSQSRSAENVEWVRETRQCLLVRTKTSIVWIMQTIVITIVWSMHSKCDECALGCL